MSVAPAAFSAAILLTALVMFVSERVRHDLIAVGALIACVALGLVAPADALTGFGDPAVIAVAAVLIVGRALESTGIAALVARKLIPATAPFAMRLAILLVVAALLSAFMNNIAALVITMPLATAIARDAGRGPSSALMPLAFATILGGMTTLIGTPANLILSSVRERELGAPFGFFAMSPVGVTVCVAGLAYLALVGWRLLPERRSADSLKVRPWRVLELTVGAAQTIGRHALAAALRKSSTRLLALFRNQQRREWPGDDGLDEGDTLLLLSRKSENAIREPLPWLEVRRDEGAAVARMVVAHGSPLVGEGYAAVTLRSGGLASVVAAGPRAAKLRQPLASLQIMTGDQLFVAGPTDVLGSLASRLRLLEIDRSDPVAVDVRSAAMTAGIFVCAIVATVLGGWSPAISFLAAAALIAAFKLISPDEIYTSIDWSIIVLLGAMIPVGASFETSGAAAILAGWLGDLLAGAPVFFALATVCTATLILSVFLNNVATSVIMGPLAIKVAMLLGIAPDAMLLAVLIGASSDFLTPIGHQNNLLVMGPGGYRFGDYARAGAILSLIVVVITALVLAGLYG
jgi:di/tricarboxylate transporter